LPLGTLGQFVLGQGRPFKGDNAWKFYAIDEKGKIGRIGTNKKKENERCRGKILGNLRSDFLFLSIQSSPLSYDFIQITHPFISFLYLDVGQRHFPLAFVFGQRSRWPLKEKMRENCLSARISFGEL
jgi:hypothetical protein